MRRLLEPARLDRLALGLLALAAVCVLVAGLQHARLYHRGYAEVEIVGLSEIGALAAFVAAASGSEDEDRDDRSGPGGGDDSGRGRGRGRGRDDDG